MKFFILLISMVDGLSKVFAVMGAALIVPLIGALTYEVFSRYILLNPTFWAYEMSYMLMGSIFLLGMAYTLKTRQHVNVDILYSALPARGRASLEIIGFAILLIALFWMVTALFNYALDAYEYKEKSGASGWNPVIWPFRVVWLVGFTLLGLQTAGELAKAIYTLVVGKFPGETS